MALLTGTSAQQLIIQKKSMMREYVKAAENVLVSIIRIQLKVHKTQWK
jgi:hypothetical protein